MPTTGGRDSAAEQPSSQGADEKAQRSLQRARLFMWVSAGLLLVSLVAVAACTRVEWSRVVPYLMWSHVAVIVVFGFGIFAVRRLRSNTAKRVSPRPRELFAPWLLATAIVAAAFAIPSWSPSPWETRHAPDGSVATTHQWHASADGTRYYESFNRGPEREISRADFQELERSMFSGFARMWVLFSFIALVMWRFVALRWQGELNPGPGVSSSGSASSLAAPAESTQGWKSTAAIAAIWVLVIGSNLLSLAHAPHAAACTALMPPEMQWVVLLMPLVFFGGAALFAKRSPFISPWIAGLIDEKLGAGVCEGFMVHLKPMLLFSAAGLIGAAGLAFNCRHSGAGHIDWTVPGFLASGSIAFGLMHFVMRWRRVPGV